MRPSLPIRILGCLALSLAAAGRAAAGDCIYAEEPGRLAVFRHPDMTKLFSVEGIEVAVAYNLAVDGDNAYLNRQPIVDGDPFSPGRVHQIDLIARAQVAEFETGRGNSDQVLARGKVYVANAVSDSVTVIDPGLGEVQTLASVGDYPRRTAATPDGSRVFVSADTGVVYVIDPTDDRVVSSFAGRRALGPVLATDDLVFIAGEGIGDSGGLIVFAEENGTYSEVWRQNQLGFSRRLAILGDVLYSMSRSEVESVSLLAPHRIDAFALADRLIQRLHDMVALDGFLYVTSTSGVFRYSPADGTSELVDPAFHRVIAAGRCPRDTFTFAGDADCDATLGEADVDATVRAIFDTTVRCFADCGGDGRVGAADVGCTLNALRPQ